MPKAARQGIAEFAAKRKTDRNPCWMCNIPERAEVEEAVLAGLVNKTDAMLWLKDECGYGDEATHNKVDRHFTNHVKSQTAR